jgi:5-methylcytosine-specific restriction protein A
MGKAMKRSEQILQLGLLKPGRTYTRAKIAEIGEVPPLQNGREWTGIQPFKNCTLLFVTLDRPESIVEHRYQYEFHGCELHWDSQNSNHSTTPKIRRLKDPAEIVLLFARIKTKIKSKTQPFYYCGELQYITSHSERPVRFHWKLSDYPHGLEGSPRFEALATWRAGDRIPPNRSALPFKTSRSPFPEGVQTAVTANRYEWDPRARAECISNYSASCWICGFDYEQEYGPIGAEYIEIHHCIPIAQRAVSGAYELDPFRDLRPLCANCHRMVHRKPMNPVEGSGSLPDEAWERLLKLRELACCDAWEDIEN